MGGFNCKRVPVNSFNRLGEAKGVSVVSRDDRVDRRDDFFMIGEDATRKGLGFGARAVQSIMKEWQLECRAMKRSASSSKFKALARAFGIGLGMPAVDSDGEAQRFGVFKKGKYLFDVDANEDIFAAVELDTLAPRPLPDAHEIYGGKAPSTPRTGFTERRLAVLLARKLGVPVPLRYRVRMMISRPDLSKLKRMGVNISAGREEIVGPSGGRLYYGGSYAEGGFTKSAKLVVESDTLIKVIMTNESGDERASLFPIKARPVETAVEDEAIDEIEEADGETIRDGAERGKKRTITGPGISITVYD